MAQLLGDEVDDVLLDLERLVAEHRVAQPLGTVRHRTVLHPRAQAPPLGAGLAVNTLFEQLSGELLQARYENARYASIRTACQLILRDEARHIQFGRIVMRRFFRELSADDRRMLGEKVAKKLRGSLLNGVYAVVNLPPDERARAGRNRALACEHGLGATHPDEEMAIIKRALDQIRADVAPYDVVIPEVPKVDRLPPGVH